MRVFRDEPSLDLLCHIVRARFDKNKAATAAPVNAIAVTMKVQMLFPVLLISCTFIPNTEEARLVGMKMKAKMVTVKIL